MVTRQRERSLPRVALAAPPGRTTREATAVLSARGFELVEIALADAADADAAVIAYIPDGAPSPREASELLSTCRRAAEAGRPVVVLAAFPDAPEENRHERAAALGALVTHGAVLAPSPDVWFETVALLAWFGAPAGPRSAIVAPEGGLLRLEADALATEDAARGAPRVPLAGDSAGAPPVDAVLVDVGELPHPRPATVGPALVIPVRQRGEVVPDAPTGCLVGLRAALAACALAGLHAQRLAEGLGPAATTDMDVEVNRTRVAKSLARSVDRLGDHECKLLLSAYGVPVTRQGVASTPSAAVRIAQTCGFPVEMKPWDPKTASEGAGGPVVRDVVNAPDVRRAYAQLAADSGETGESAVIVRVTPPGGRTVSVRCERQGSLGWIVVVDIPGLPAPLAAPCPLRVVDAWRIAGVLEASRAGEAVLDRTAFAQLLRGVSFAAVDSASRLASLELGRVVVAPEPEGAVVVDCRAKLVLE